MLKYVHKVIRLDGSPEEIEKLLDRLSDEDWTPIGMTEHLMVLRKLAPSNYDQRMKKELYEKETLMSN